MRAVRLTIVLLVVSMVLVLALSDSRLSRQPFAQVTAAPGPVPLTAPAAPGQPQPFSTIGALPALAAAPGFSATPAAAATPRVFRCTCSAPGTWTEWAGIVSSSSYILARQSAGTQCASHLLNDSPPSAYIPQASSNNLNAQRPTTYNGTAFTQRAQVSTSVGQSFLQQRSQTTQLTTQCSQCACN